MAYIGKIPLAGAFRKCDAITTSSTATYNLTVSSVAVSPESANNCIVSLNGVIQAPTSAYTIAGSTIVFNSSLTSADVVDFILILGDVLSIGTPSDDSINSNHYVDGSIDTAHIADDQITLAKMAAGTDGQIITYDASGNPAAVGPGSDGQVLTSTGAGSPPAFEAAPGGGFTHLKTTTISSGTATVDFSHGSGGVVFDSTYNAYLFILSDVHPANDGIPFELTFSTDAGSSYLSSGYAYAHKGRRSGGADMNHNSASDSVIDCTSNNIGNGVVETVSMQLWFHKPSNADGHKLVSMHSAMIDNDGHYVATVSMGSNSSTSAITGVRFKFGTGNIDRGSFTMIGVKNS